MEHHIATCSLCGQTAPVDSQHTVFTSRVLRSSRKTGFKETTRTTIYLDKQQHTGCVCAECRKKADRRKKVAFLIDGFLLVLWLGSSIRATVANLETMSPRQALPFTIIGLALSLLFWVPCVRGLYRWANIEHRLAKKFAQTRKKQESGFEFKGFTAAELRRLGQTWGDAIAAGVSAQKCTRCGTTIEGGEITCPRCGKTDYTSAAICLVLGVILIAIAALLAERLIARLLWGLPGAVCLLVFIAWALEALRSHDREKAGMDSKPDESIGQRPQETAPADEGTVNVRGRDLRETFQNLSLLAAHQQELLDRLAPVPQETGMEFFRFLGVSEPNEFDSALSAFHHFRSFALSSQGSVVRTWFLRISRETNGHTALYVHIDDPVIPIGLAVCRVNSGVYLGYYSMKSEFTDKLGLD